jgi:serine/threonine-protein phosphatase 2B catalytic subunit
LLKEGKIKKKDFMDLINRFIGLLKKEPNVLEIEDPVTVVGDIHGQFYDVPKIFEAGGDPKDHKYLFLGDYVDRGSFSVEVIVYLYSLKVIFLNVLYSLFKFYITNCFIIYFYIFIS